MDVDAENPELTDFGKTILAQDQRVLDDCMPEVLPNGGAAVGVDAYLTACRRLYEGWLRSNSLIGHTYPTDQGDEVAVVPSPVGRLSRHSERHGSAPEDVAPVLECPSEVKRRGAKCSAGNGAHKQSRKGYDGRRVRRSPNSFGRSSFCL